MLYTQFAGFSQAGSKNIEILEAGVNADIGSNAAQDLRNSTNHRLNQVPFVVGFDGEITQLIISARDANVFSIQLIINGTVEATYTRDGTNIHQTFDIATPIEVEKGDLIRLRYTGGTGTTRRPFVKLTIQES